MWTSGKESPWKGLTEVFIRSIHQLPYFKTGFFLCTSPGFIRTKLLVDNYWQHCTLLNTLTEVLQTVYASVMQYINYALIWQTHNIHCVSHGSPPTTAHRNFCLCNSCCQSTLNTPAHTSCPCRAQAGGEVTIHLQHGLYTEPSWSIKFTEFLHITPS